MKATFGDRFSEITMACGWLTDTLRHPSYDDLPEWFDGLDSSKSARALTAAATIDQRAEWLPHLLPTYLTSHKPRDRTHAEECGTPWAWNAKHLSGAHLTAWRIAYDSRWCETADDRQRERAAIHARLLAFSALGEPAKPAEIAKALATLLAVVDQQMPAAMAGFIVEILARSHAPLPAVLSLMEHVARTEGGKVKPATFAAAIEAIGERRHDLNYAAVQPARDMLKHWAEALDLLGHTAAKVAA
jgi:hypothetical protein